MLIKPILFLQQTLGHKRSLALAVTNKTNRRQDLDRDYLMLESAEVVSHGRN